MKGLYKRRGKTVPLLPQSLTEMNTDDDHYKKTSSNQKFLILHNKTVFNILLPIYLIKSSFLSCFNNSTIEL